MHPIDKNIVNERVEVSARAGANQRKRYQLPRRRALVCDMHPTHVKWPRGKREPRRATTPPPPQIIIHCIMNEQCRAGRQSNLESNKCVCERMRSAMREGKGQYSGMKSAQSACSGSEIWRKPNQKTGNGKRARERLGIARGRVQAIQSNGLPCKSCTHTPYAIQPIQIDTRFNRLFSAS